MWLKNATLNFLKMRFYRFYIVLFLTFCIHSHIDIYGQEPYLFKGEKKIYGINILDRNVDNYLKCYYTINDTVYAKNADELDGYFIPPDSYYKSEVINFNGTLTPVFVKRLNDFSPYMYIYETDKLEIFFVRKSDSLLVQLPSEPAAFKKELTMIYPDHPLKLEQINRIKKDVIDVTQFLDMVKTGEPHVINSKQIGGGLFLRSVKYMVNEDDYYDNADNGFPNGFDGPSSFLSTGIAGIYDTPIELSNFYSRTGISLASISSSENPGDWNHASLGLNTDIDYVLSFHKIRPFVGVGYEIQLNTISKYYLNDPSLVTLYTGLYVIAGTKLILPQGTNIMLSIIYARSGIISKDKWQSIAYGLYLLF